MVVPPPARGWPPIRNAAVRSSTGSPARAGMARPIVIPPRNFMRFPRPRGDGPPIDTLSAIATVPPPARGWPLLTPGDVVFLGGSPARAGMAPKSGSRRLVT